MKVIKRPKFHKKTQIPYISALGRTTSIVQQHNALVCDMLIFMSYKLHTCVIKVITLQIYIQQTFLYCVKDDKLSWLIISDPMMLTYSAMHIMQYYYMEIK